MVKSMIRMLLVTSVVLVRVCLGGQVAATNDSDFAALSGGTVASFVVVEDDQRIPLRVELKSRELAGGQLEIVPVVTNATSAPIAFQRVVLFERVALPPPSPVGRDMHAIGLDSVPLLASAPIERENFLAASHPDRTFPFVIAVLPLPPDAANVVAPNVRIEGTVVASLRAEWTSEATYVGISFHGTEQRLIPGASLTLPSIWLSRGGADDDLLTHLDALFRTIWTRSGREPPVLPAIDSIAIDAAPLAIAVEPVELSYGGNFPLPRFGAPGWPLDLMRTLGDASHPELWVTSTEGAARIAVLSNDVQSKVLGVSARELGLAGSSAYVVREGDRELGEFGSRFGVIASPGTRRLLDVEPSKSNAHRPLAYRFISPASADSVTVSAEPPRDELDALSRTKATLDQSGIVLIDLPGGDSIEALPASIAEFLLPQFAVQKVTTRASTPSSDSEKYTKQAANAEWVFGLPPVPQDAASWLVSFEAGFLATPFQPRVVDGMPGARAFAVFTFPGVLVVTLGLGDQALDQVAKNVTDLRTLNDAIAKVVQATQAVRLSREPSGLVKAFGRYPRWRTEDLVPGDPIVNMRWTSIAPLGSSRRLVSLPVEPGGALITEDVLEFIGPLTFALDLPSPFDRPFLGVVRRMEGDGELTLHFDGRPLTRLARTPRDRGRWVEELYVLRPEDFPGQVRVALSFEPSAGIGRIARATFFAPRKVGGLALGFVAPSGLAPGPASIATSQRFDGSPLMFGGEAHENGFTMLAGSRLEFALSEKQRFRRLQLKATAPEGEPEQGGGWLIVTIDGEEAGRYDLRPGRPEAVSVRIEKGSMKSIRFDVEARTSKFERGSVLLLDPRVE